MIPAWENELRGIERERERWRSGEEIEVSLVDHLSGSLHCMIARLFYNIFRAEGAPSLSDE